MKTAAFFFVMLFNLRAVPGWVMLCPGCQETVGQSICPDLAFSTLKGLVWLQAARIPPSWKCHSMEHPKHWYLQCQHMTATKPLPANIGTCCTALCMTWEPPPCRGAGRHLLMLIKTSCNTCFVSFMRGKNIALVVKVIWCRQGSMGLGAFLGWRPQSCN